MTKQKIDKNQEAVIHHLHHRAVEDDTYKRELSINGSIYSVSLSSDCPDENMNYLTEKALFILKDLIKEGK